MLNALLVFLVVVIVNLLASELPIVKNALLNIFIWAAIVSLFVGIGSRSLPAWR